MAKSAKSKKEPATVTSKLLAQSLVEVDLVARPEVVESDKVELRYSAMLDTPEEIGENKFFFRCNFSVVKRNSDTDEELQAVMATYACILQNSSDDMLKVAASCRRYVATSVWNAFTSLFAVVSHQMRAPFPPLPPSPGGVGASGVSSFAEPEPELMAVTEDE